MSLPLVLLLFLAAGQAEPPAAPPKAPAPAAPAPGLRPPEPTSDTTVPEDPPDTDPVALPPRRPVIRPFQMPPVIPSEPVPYDPPTVAPEAPVTVENYRRSYEPPPNALEAYYEKGVKGAFNAEQSLMGPLDGQWNLRGPEGSVLFTVLLNDPGEVTPIDGAWRDLRPGRQGAGLIESAVRDRDVLVLMIREGDDERETVIHLQLLPDNRWRGEIHDANGARRTVVMSRN